MPGGEIWGGQIDLPDLPTATWAAAMNLCDVPVTVALPAVFTDTTYRVSITPYTASVDTLTAVIPRAANIQTGEWALNVVNTGNARTSQYVFWTATGRWH